MYWSSHKDKPNYLVNTLTSELLKILGRKKYKDKYGLILEYMDKGYITIYKTEDEQIPEGFKRLKAWTYRVEEVL